MATSSSKPTPAPITYDELDPAFEESREEGPDTIRIHLPGFKRDNIRVQVDNYGNLTASGERPIDGTRKSRFRKDFSIPERCNVDDIHALFENEVLYIVLPKKKATIQPAPQTTTTEPQPKPQPQPQPQPAPETGAGGVSAAERATKQAGAKISELAGAKATGETARKGVKDSDKEKERAEGDGKVVGDDKGEERTEKGVVKQPDKRGMEQKTETVTSGSLEDETGTKTVSGLTKPRAQQLLLNVVVAILVLMVLAMFATYKLAKTT